LPAPTEPTADPAYIILAYNSPLIINEFRYNPRVLGTIAEIDRLLRFRINVPCRLQLHTLADDLQELVDTNDIPPRIVIQIRPGF
jgi:hypothetical protein